MPYYVFLIILGLIVGAPMYYLSLSWYKKRLQEDRASWSGL